MGCSRSIRRESIIADLAQFFKSFDEVEGAAVFGSLARNDPQARDMDVAVKFSKRSDLLSLGFLVYHMAKALGVSEDCIDITPEELEERRREISIVSEALRYGVEL